MKLIDQFHVNTLTMSMKKQGFLLHPLLHSGNLVEDRLRIRLAPYGIQPRQARVLEALSRMGPVSQVKLAREFHISAASMSTMSSRLIAAKLISRKPDSKTARSNILTLTVEGRKMLIEIHKAWHDMDQIIVDALGAERAQTFGDMARELRNSLGGHRPGGKCTKSGDEESA
ncbi:MAG: MarR family winged helix-turn-helix transcriptional regulator [Alphaproteobacteria bacterium]